MKKPIKYHFAPMVTPQRIRALKEHYTDGHECIDILEKITARAEDILIASGFPEHSLRPPFDDINLRQQIEAAGFDWESSEGYAVRILLQAGLVATSLDDESLARNTLAGHAMQFGNLVAQAAMHKFWELSVHWGGKKGAKEAAKGRVSYHTLRELYGKEIGAGAKPKQAYAAVAKQTDVKARTVQRAVTGY